MLLKILKIPKRSTHERSQLPSILANRTRSLRGLTSASSAFPTNMAHFAQLPVGASSDSNPEAPGFSPTCRYSKWEASLTLEFVQGSRVSWRHGVAEPVFIPSAVCCRSDNRESRRLRV